MGFSLLRTRSRRNNKTPAMRVRDRCYIKKSPFRYNRVVQATMITKGKVILMANKSNDMAHTKWMCKYHIVFTPKYRRKIIYNQYRESIGTILRQLCNYKGVASKNCLLHFQFLQEGLTLLQNLVTK